MNVRRLALLFAVVLFPPAALTAGCGSGTPSAQGDGGGGGIGDQDSGNSGNGDGGFTTGDSSSTSDTGAKDSGADAHPWPTCDTQPAAAPTMTIPEIWTANSSTPTLAWVSGVTISAISFGGCSAGHACQIYLQQDATYATLSDGAHKALKMYVTSTVADHFAGLHVGDTVNAMGFGWRNTTNQQSEIQLEVTADLEGCAKKTGTLALTPIQGVTLADVNVDNYENVYGPLLIEVDDVHGTTTGNLTEIFGVFEESDSGVADAGPELVSLSPFYLPNGTFASPMTTNTATHFSKIVGVLGLYIPPSLDGGIVPKFNELYPRTMSDLSF